MQSSFAKEVMVRCDIDRYSFTFIFFSFSYTLNVILRYIKRQEDRVGFLKKQLTNRRKYG
jgi:hypothetical protein